MKYSKPSLRTFDSNNEMRCGNGSAASSSGCTAGADIGTSCGVGNSNVLCYDGIGGPICASGSSPNFSLNRCGTGTVVS